MKGEDIGRLCVNPFYAIKINETLSMDHEFIIPEETWINANVNLIEEIGSYEWLKLLLDVLKGNYITSTK